MPGLPFLQQLAANPAAATQLMQGLTSMLGAAQAAPAAPATPPPAASASVTLPQPPAALPERHCPAEHARRHGAPALPTERAAAGQMSVPNVPFLPVPLPQAVSFPGDLAALMPAGVSVANLATAAPTAAVARGRACGSGGSCGTGGACVRAWPPLLMPLSALP